MDDAARSIVITGVGAVSSLGRGQSALWRGITAGLSGITTLRRFPTDRFRVRTGAVVPDFDGDDSGAPSDVEALCLRFAREAAQEAIADADAGDLPPERIGIVFGTGLGGVDRPVHKMAELLAQSMGARGPCLTISNACSSSTAAIGVARDLLAMGAADAVIAGGADVLSPEVFAGFHALGVLSPTKCAPFSFPAGTTMGEGAGFLVLERREHARCRGARERAALSGYGLSGDGFHETSPDPTGSGVERALRGALEDADLAPEAIGYVNAHGSGTAANDGAEWNGIRRGLGSSASRIPVSSSKGALGHAQGAAGSLEAIVTLLSMEHGVVPPSLHFVGPRPHGPVDPVGSDQPRAWSYEHALCLNSAFGGANAALVLSRHASAPFRLRRPVFMAGAGRVQDKVDGPSIDSLLPRADWRGTDSMGRVLTAAAALALRDAGMVLRGAERDRTGLFVGAVRPSCSSMKEFQGSIRDRGLEGVSAPAFARIVLNAPGGFCSKLLSLKGPLSTIAAGPGSGLVAIILAAELLSTATTVDTMLAGGVDEIPGEDGESAGHAACLVLRRDRGDGSFDSRIRLAGWGLGGPADIEATVARALSAPARGTAEPSMRIRAEDFVDDDNEASASSAACIAAWSALEKGGAASVLVTLEGGRSLTAALCLTREGG